MGTLFDGFYQFGYVARDLDRATAALSDSHGIDRFRRKRASDVMESAHAWIGAVMIEIIAISPGGPDIYDAFIPDDPDAIRLHHHGYRVPDAAAWGAVNRQVAQGGWDTPLKGAVMNGQLNYLYVDTRASLGLYSEYVYLTGAATALYDDVPHN